MTDEDLVLCPRGAELWAFGAWLAGEVAGYEQLAEETSDHITAEESRACAEVLSQARNKLMRILEH